MEKACSVKSWGTVCTAPWRISTALTLHIYHQTEDKEFEDLEERFQWVSVCVTELKSNVAAYLDHLEVRPPHS